MTLACRVWARGAFYQAGGAYGFHDQLQDVMALTMTQRDVAWRSYSGRSAAVRGGGRSTGGIHRPAGACGPAFPMTCCGCRMWSSTIWKSLARSRLDEVVPFLDGPDFAVGEDESYFQPRVSTQRGTLFEHCARALDRSLAVGSHGLPLIGTGDWNDVMNRVGQGGQARASGLAGFCTPSSGSVRGWPDARVERQRAEMWRSYAAPKAVARTRGVGWRMVSACRP